jgi:isopropylmalate/homocitrate/citramalate synthase
VAVRGTAWIKERLPRLKGTEVMFQYSPESFSGTEVEFAKEISDAVIEVWQPTPQHKMILNLPDTVEVAMPNVYADQIEWMCRNVKKRDSIIVSLHTHNDRSTGVAATELGLLAGAERVEGTLFGNGERTGNLDIVTVALNLYMHGIDPKLDFSNLNSIIEVYERCTGMTVPARQPYAGELVFTAFSGSHQDAIRKGLGEPFENFWKWLRKQKREGKTLVQAHKLLIEPDEDQEKVLITPSEGQREYKFSKTNAQKVWTRFHQLKPDERFTTSLFQAPKWNDCPDWNSPWIVAAIHDYLKEAPPAIWDVPYLTIDPTDIGREYHEVIRVNSQSGKGGVAYLLENEFGIQLPKEMQREFGPIANDEVDKLGREVSGTELKAMFWREYVERLKPWRLVSFETESKDGMVKCRAELAKDGKPVKISGQGNGPLAALVHGLGASGGPLFEITAYSEHALSAGEEAAAIAYIQIKTTDGKSRWGAGVDTNIELASVRAVLSALNRV